MADDEAARLAEAGSNGQGDEAAAAGQPPAAERQTSCYAAGKVCLAISVDATVRKVHGPSTGPLSRAWRTATPPPGGSGNAPRQGACDGEEGAESERLPADSRSI
jgi:hypothetical protein